LGQPRLVKEMRGALSMNLVSELLGYAIQLIDPMAKFNR